MHKLLAKAALILATNGGVGAPLGALEQTQWLKREKLRALQFRRLKAMLRHARRTVPYYNTLDPRTFDVRSLDDLARLPILTRRDLRKQFDRLQSSEQRTVRVVQSGGSTGLPVWVRKTNVTLRMQSAAQYRAYRWLGFDFGQRNGYMFPVYAGQGFRVKLADKLLNRVSLNTFDTNKAMLEGFTRALGARPIVLLGSPSALLLLAHYVTNSAHSLKVNLIISQAEQLLPHERERLASSFHADVYDFYGSNEIGSIAAECPERTGHHISSENLIVEIIGRDRAQVSEGDIGSVVITDLNNYAMPLIRYEIGDLSSPLDDDCSCGRGLPLIGQIEGRITDVIATPEGHFMCLSDFSSRVINKTHVEQYQIYQPSTDRLIVRAILTPEFRGIEGKFIERGIQALVGQGIKVTAEFHEKLEIAPSGKRRTVISDVMPRNVGSYRSEH